MARTKQTARKSSGGKAPRKMMATKSASQLRQYLTGRQAATYASAKPSQQQKTSYINYENMFYSYFFPTGPRSTQTFEPRFTSGAGTHPISGKKEQWLGMSFNSKFDGDGIKEHGRPHLNVSIALDVSGSMGSPFEQDAAHGTKLDVAKKCLQTLTDQLKPSDRFGLVGFNHQAMVHCPMRAWSTVNKTSLKQDIGNLRAHGLTCLSAAIDSATEMFSEPFEHTHSTSRIIFLTDLCSTVDSVNDEHKLLSTIKKNAERGIYTTVVGIGMDLNVRLVEEISKTAGAKYCSVDSSHEFQQIMNNEFDYDTTILAFDIKVELQSPDYQLVKGYGSPELNAVKPGKPVVISSEFPCWQNDQGESKGGMMLFKMEQKKGRKNPADEVKVCISWRDVNGVTHRDVVTVNLNDSFVDVGTRKAVLMVHYVDLHNDYVHDCRQNKIKFLEMFQAFRTHFVKELEEMGDNSWSTYNKGDLELVDKIIELEQKPEGSGAAPGPSGFGPSVTFNPILTTFTIPGSRSKVARPTTKQSSSSQRRRPAQQRGAKRLTRSKGQQSASRGRAPPSPQPLPAAGASVPQARHKKVQAVGQVGTRRSARIAAQLAPSAQTGIASQTRKRKASPSQAKDLGPSSAKKRKPAPKQTAKSSAVSKGRTRKTQK